MLKHIDHLNLTVENLADSLRWYGELFDFAKVEEGVYKGAPWAIVRSGEALLCMYEHPDYALRSPDELKAHGVNHFGLRVTDGPAFAARAASLGVEVNYGGAFDWPHSTSYYVNDPTGHEIEVAAWDNDQVQF